MCPCLQFLCIPLKCSDEADSSDSEESEESQRLSTVTFLYERLVDKSKSQPVVFIGESDNRSMPIALAVLRGNLEGIWATSRLPVEPWTFSGFEELLEKQIAQAKINWELKKPPMSDVDRMTTFSKTAQPILIPC